MAEVPELVHRILVTNARSVRRGTLFERIRPLFGEGIATSEGATHLRHRRVMQPALHPANIGAHTETIRRNTQALADSWHDGQTVDVCQATLDLVVTNTTEAMFGVNVGGAAMETLRAVVPPVLDGGMMRAQLPAVLHRLPLPANRRWDAGDRGLHRVIDEIIAHRRRHPGDAGDLIGMLLAARDPKTGRPMSDRQIHDEIVSIFFAGIATTSTTLAWLLHRLPRNPAVEEGVLTELAEVTGLGLPLDQTVARLDYTRRALQEILRLHPLLLILRTVTAPLVLAGVPVPAGTEVGYSPTALHRDAATYPEPRVLDPDRWLPERAEPLPAGAFAAFGEGRHRCIGEHFAWAQLLTAAVLLLPRWKLRHAHDPERAREINALHPRPDHLLMTVTARR